MENAMLIGLSKQMALGHQMDMIANNMANVETAGYKAEHLLFEEYLMPTAQINGLNGDGKRLSYVFDPAMFREFSEGAFSPTGNVLDVAINGKGWLVVDTPAGERFTRNGHLKLNAQGELVTSSGRPVLGVSGPITFAPGETKITISTDGTITSSAGIKGKLRVVSFDDEKLLKKQGDNLYSSPAAPSDAENYRIAQGVIERSNVKPVIEMTKMIEVMRSYISTSSLLEQMGDLQRRAIERLGEAA